jgi:hypothetical protein
MTAWAAKFVTSNTGLSSPGELEITCRTSELAVCFRVLEKPMELNKPNLILHR